MQIGTCHIYGKRLTGQARAYSQSEYEVFGQDGPPSQVRPDLLGRVYRPGARPGQWAHTRGPGLYATQEAAMLALYEAWLKTHVPPER